MHEFLETTEPQKAAGSSKTLELPINEAAVSQNLLTFIIKCSLLLFLETKNQKMWKVLDKSLIRLPFITCFRNAFLCPSNSHLIQKNKCNSKYFYFLATILYHRCIGVLKGCFAPYNLKKLL